MVFLCFVVFLRHNPLAFVILSLFIESCEEKYVQLQLEDGFSIEFRLRYGRDINLRVPRKVVLRFSWISSWYHQFRCHLFIGFKLKNLQNEVLILKKPKYNRFRSSPKFFSRIFYGLKSFFFWWKNLGNFFTRKWFKAKKVLDKWD